MLRRATIHGVLFQTGAAAAFAAALVLFSTLGCTTTKTDLLRPQQAEETGRERYGVKTVGDCCMVADVGPKYVGGVGIVTGLDGTGGDSPKDENRAALEKYLLQYASKYHLQRTPTIGEIMNSGSAALVIVSGEIPPGTRPGERFDVEVFLPRGSKATSLRGGVLETCLLTTYDYAHGPEGASIMKGHEIASAEGPLQLSLGSSQGDDDAERLTRAHIWEGGYSKIDNTLSLLLNADQQASRMSAHMAECINQTFAVGSAGDVKLAIPVLKDGVRLRVPPAYKLNIPHYLRVVRLIPMEDPGEQPSDAPGQPKSYRQRLAEDLLDPTRTVTAALRLESLGQKSVPVLKQGLESKHPLIQFCAAESLTYLGHGIGAQKLGELVEQQPFLRSYALSALASLDENVTRAKLQDLMEKGVADETRYGAFRALQALAPADRLTKGEWLNKSFRLHHVAPESASLLHVCTAKRAEIVMFGPEAKFVPPFAFESNGYTVTAYHAADTQCMVGVVPPHGKPIRVACNLNVSDVLHLLAKMDATYPEVVEILVAAANGKQVNCPVALNALPQVPSAEELAASGKNGQNLLDLGGQELGDTPTVFERPAPKPAPRNRDADTSRGE